MVSMENIVEQNFGMSPRETEEALDNLLKEFHLFGELNAPLSPNEVFFGDLEETETGLKYQELSDISPVLDIGNLPVYLEDELMEPLSDTQLVFEDDPMNPHFDHDYVLLAQSPIAINSNVTVLANIQLPIQISQEMFYMAEKSSCMLSPQSTNPSSPLGEIIVDDECSYSSSQGSSCGSEFSYDATTSDTEKINQLISCKKTNRGRPKISPQVHLDMAKKVKKEDAKVYLNNAASIKYRRNKAEKEQKKLDELEASMTLNEKLRERLDNLRSGSQLLRDLLQKYSQ